MTIEFDGGFGLIEVDLPTITVRDESYGRYAQSSDGEWSWEIDQENDEMALQAVKANLAYWLWRQRNPNIVNPVDPAARAEILSVLLSADWIDAEDLADTLARAGFHRG